MSVFQKDNLTSKPENMDKRSEVYEPISIKFTVLTVDIILNSSVALQLSLFSFRAIKARGSQNVRVGGFCKIDYCKDMR